MGTRIVRLGLVALIGAGLLVGACADDEQAEPVEDAAATTTVAATVAESGQAGLNPEGLTDASVPVPPTSDFETPTLPIGGTEDSAVQLIRELVEWPADLGENPVDSVSLDRCELMAPGYWRFDGEVTSGVERFELPAAFTFSTGDVGGGVAWLVEVNGTGPFSVVVRDLGQWDRVDRCSVMFGSRTHEAYADATGSTEPLVWEAPEGTIQGLGVGAVMADTDDLRRAWAAPIWLETPLPFGRILAPEPGSGIAVREVHAEIVEDSTCRIVTQRVGDRGSISQTVGCPEPATEPGTPVELPPGDWAIDGEAVATERLVRFGAAVDDYEITIYAEDVEALTEILSGLSWFENVRPAPKSDSPYVGVDLESVIESTLAAEGYEEMARIDTDDGLFVVAKGPIVGDAGVDPYAQQRTYEFERRGQSWVGRYGGGGGWDSCVHQGQALVDGVLTYFVVGFDPTWTFEAGQDGEWIPMPMESGAALFTQEVFDALETEQSSELFISYRAVTPDGDVIDCSTFVPGYARSRTDTTHVAGDSPVTDISTP